MMLSAATIITSPTAAPMIALRAPAAFCGSPPEVMYCSPATIMMMTAATPAMVAMMRETFLSAPCGPLMGSLPLAEQADESPAPTPE